MRKTALQWVCMCMCVHVLPWEDICACMLNESVYSWASFHLGTICVLVFIKCLYVLFVLHLLNMYVCVFYMFIEYEFMCICVCVCWVCVYMCVFSVCVFMQFVFAEYINEYVSLFAEHVLVCLRLYVCLQSVCVCVPVLVESSYMFLWVMITTTNLPSFSG